MEGGKKKLAMGILAISTLFAQSCVSLIAPFYPIEAAKKGASDSLIGLVFSCAEFMVFTMSPVFGSLVSRISARFIFIAGLCVFGTCDVMFGFLNRSPGGLPYISICVAVRMVEGTGTAALLTSASAIASNIYPEKISTVYSILQSANGIGFILGPVLGGILYETGGFGFPFWILGSCVFLCGCVSMFLLPEQKPVPKRVKSNPLSLFRSPRVCYGALAMCSFMMAQTVYFPLLAQELTKFGVSPGVVGGVIILTAVCFALTTPIVGIMLDKNVKPLPLLILGLFGNLVFLMIFGPAPFLYFIPSNFWIHVLCCAGLGISSGFSCSPASRYIIAGARDIDFDSEEERQGLVAGFIQSSICFGTFVGPLIGGVLADHFGFRWTLTIVGFYCMLPVLLGFFALCVKQKKKLQKKIDESTPLLDGNDNTDEYLTV